MSKALMAWHSVLRSTSWQPHPAVSQQPPHLNRRTHTRRICQTGAFSGTPFSSSASLVAARKELGLQLLQASSTDSAAACCGAHSMQRCTRYVINAAMNTTQVLQEQDLSSSDGAVSACADLVAQAKAAVAASSDAAQLHKAFQQAADQYNVPADTRPQQRRSSNPWGMPTPTRRSKTNTASTSTTASSSAVSMADSGFSSSNRASTSSCKASSGGVMLAEAAGSSEPAANSAAAQAPQLRWEWGTVQHLVAYGTGSFGEYSRLLSSGARTEQECSRAGMRLFQLALLLHIQEHLLPGLVALPQLFDPQFDAFDRALLERLGMSVLPADEECRHAAHVPTLVYMPCCPRELYDNILDANWTTDHLTRLAVIGTSFRSLAGSALLFQALTAGQQQGQPQPQQQGRVAVLSGKGAVVEAFCPDCAAHGIATSLHLFPPGRTCGVM